MIRILTNLGAGEAKLCKRRRDQGNVVKIYILKCPCTTVSEALLRPELTAPANFGHAMMQRVHRCVKVLAKYASVVVYVCRLSQNGYVYDIYIYIYIYGIYV